MAQIKLDIVTNIDKKASAEIKAVSTSLAELAKTINGIQPNQDLTKQLSALARAYQSIARQQNAELKQARITTENAKANKLAAQAATEKAKANKLAAQTAVENAKTDRTAAQASAERAKTDGITARTANDAKRAQAQMLKAQTQARAQEWKETQAATKATQNNTQAVKRSTQTNQKHTQSILSMAAGFLQWQIAATLIMKPLQKIREAIASINETLVKTEDTVIGLQRVLDETISNEEISDKLYTLAKRYSQTFDNVSAIATNFARTGMSWVDTIKATEAALLALNVAELDATQASDGMIAIMQQFGKEANDLEGIIDMLNKTADGFAVSTDKLLKALQRTGSSAKNANLTLEETIGIVTALSEATGRSGENLGTAVNSLIQYSSKASALDIFASLDEGTANMVEKYRMGAATILDIWEEVSRVINNMDERQESILVDLANSEDIQNLNSELSEELGDIFEQVSDVYGTANTFRKNYFIALLGNMKTVKEAAETAMNSAGYSQSENLQYLNTYTAKVNRLEAAWQHLANDEQGWLEFKKGLVEAGIDVLDIVDNIGGLTNALLIAAPIVSMVFGRAAVSGIMNFAANISKSETSVWNLHKNLQLLKIAQTEEAQATAQAIALRQAASAKDLESSVKVQLLAQAEEAETLAAQKNASAKQAQAAAIGNYLTYATLIISAIIAIDNAIETESEKTVKALNDIKEATENAFKSIDDNATAQKAEIEMLDELVERYDKLNTQEELSKEEKIILSDIVAQLSGVYKDLDFQLDSTTGKYSVLTSEIKNSRQAMIDAIETEAKYERAKTAYKSVQSTLESLGHSSVEEFRTAFEKAKDAVKDEEALYSGAFEWQAIDFLGINPDIENYMTLLSASRIIEENLPVYEKWKDELTDGTKNQKQNTTEIKTAKEAYDNYKDTVKKLTDESNELNESLNKIISANKTLITAIDEQNENGEISISTMTSLIQADNEYIHALEIENGTIRLNVQLAEKLAKTKRQEMLLDTLTAENKKKAAAEETIAVVNAEIAKQAAIRSSIQAEIERAKSGALPIDIAGPILENGAKAVSNINALLYSLGNQRYELEADVKVYDKTIALIQGLIDGTFEWEYALEGAGNAGEDANEKAKELYNTILEALRAERDVRKENLELAEKQNAVEKERQELLKAMEQRTTRVYNSRTGEWEYQADASDVLQEREDLKNAISSLDEYLENQAWEEVEKSVEEGVYDLASIKTIVARWAALSLGGNTSWTQSILDVIGKFQDGEGRTYYTNGTFTDATLEKSLLQDTSNAQTREFMNSMGIISGTPTVNYGNNAVYNNGLTSADDNRTYMLNGIPVSVDFARVHTIEEAFELLSLTD